MTFVSTQRKWAMIATRQMTIASSTSAICGSNARMPSKKETREEDQRWERHPISIVFGQTMTSFWKRIISVKIRFTRQQCSGGASGWDIRCLRRFLMIWFLRSLTFLRRRMPWVYWDFRHTKNLPRRSHVSLWNISWSVGWFNKDVRVNNTQQFATLL